MLGDCHLPHVGLKALEILSMITDAPKMTWTCDCESCIKCNSASKLFIATSSCATEALELVHSDIFGTFETAIGGGRYMLPFMDDSTRHTAEYILKNKLEAFEKFKEWQAR
jgi:hypothetical protein